MAWRGDTVLAAGYRHFLMVAEAGSVRAAARQFNLAPSAISRQIVRLEDQMGLALFERTGQALRLSAAGQALLAGLKAVSLGHQQTLDVLSGLSGLAHGHLHVATVESLSVTVLPDIMERFAARFPGINVTVTVTGSNAVTELVRGHTADIGFTFNPTVLQDLDVALVMDVPLGAALAPNHPLAKAKTLSLRECLDYPVAWPAQGLSLRTILDTVALRLKPQFRPAVECNSLRLMAAMARRGTCIAFQTRIGIEQDIAAGKLVFIPLSDKRLPRDRLMVVQRAGSHANPAADRLLALARGMLPRAAAVARK